MSETKATESLSGTAWRNWFAQVGEAATVNVVNATAKLVVAERDLARTGDVRQAAEEAAAEIISGIREYNKMSGSSIRLPFTSRVAGIISKHFPSVPSAEKMREACIEKVKAHFPLWHPVHSSECATQESSECSCDCEPADIDWFIAKLESLSNENG